MLEKRLRRAIARVSESSEAADPDTSNLPGKQTIPLQVSSAHHTKYPRSLARHPMTTPWKPPATDQIQLPRTRKTLSGLLPWRTSTPTKKETCSERFFDITNAVENFVQTNVVVETERIPTWKTRLLELPPVGMPRPPMVTPAPGRHTKTLNAAGDVIESIVTRAICLLILCALEPVESRNEACMNNQALLHEERDYFAGATKNSAKSIAHVVHNAIHQFRCAWRHSGNDSPQKPLLLPLLTKDGWQLQ